MVKLWQNVMVLLGVWATSQALFGTLTGAQLTPTFYDKTCPKLFPIVAQYVHSAIQNETRIAASLLRMHFHDCFVQGCDASLLLDGPNTEKNAIPNLNSVRGFPVIDSIKAAVEASCPNTVSCADIVTLASFFSVVLSGGPVWLVPLGRRDSFTPNASAALTFLPGPDFNITTLKQRFGLQNLTSTDLVALSGGHTIGLVRCAALQTRLYAYLGKPGNDPSISTTLLKTLEKNCPQTNNSAAGNVTNPLDIQTPTTFDNLYYKNLLQHNGVLTSDQELLTSAADTAALVNLYATNQDKFFVDFAASMIKMGNLRPLTGKQGEIRKNCHVRNSGSVIAEQQSDETLLERIVDGAEQVQEGAEKLLDGTVEYFKDAVMKIVRDIREQELQRRIEDTVYGGHTSM